MSSEYFAAATSEDEEGTELAAIHARVDGERALDVRLPLPFSVSASFACLILPFDDACALLPPSRNAEHI